MEQDPRVDDLIAFVEASPSSYHAAAEVARRLDAQGFAAHLETDAYGAEPGGHYVLRDGAIVAWWIPDGERRGFRIVGAHTDSPGFKLKPHPTTTTVGWQQAGMEVYGGPLLNSWLDREFGLAGRLVLEDGSSVLVSTPAWLRIPQLAPHLDRTVNDNLHLDRQANLMPLFSVGRPELDLLDLVAAEAGVERSAVFGHDLFAAVADRPAVFGPEGEFLASGRLDNLSSVHAGLSALLASSETGGEYVTVLAAFDHEEVGSATRSGGDGPLLESVLLRVAEGLGATGEGYARLLAASGCVSADAGHAVHPNYVGHHDPQHRPLLNAGPLLKHNANARYTTDAVSAAMWRRACARADVPTQDFVSNNAVPCGSTIGPMTATRLGIVTCDAGLPLLSMHSTRELAGTQDIGWFADALAAFYAGA